MFTELTLRNYRTHKNTTINIGPLTLMIGTNNSGKSNFLSGVSLFSSLISKANPVKNTIQPVKSYHYFANKHTLSENKEPIIFECIWIRECEIKYKIELHPYGTTAIMCREELFYKDKNTTTSYTHGIEKRSNKLLLRSIISDSSDTTSIKNKISVFFRDLAFIYYYNFQPTMLKGLAFAGVYEDGKYIPKINELSNTSNRNPAKDIGREGENFQELVKYIKQNDQETYGKFIGYLRRFESSFVEINIEGDKTKWQFDMGTPKFPYFEPDKISDGLLKAGAIALLCAMKQPPALIMLEEVENGINQRNISEFINWLITTSDNGNRCQFILTSHSPSVIREFAKKLDMVYNVHLKRKKGYYSEVINLNEAIKPLARFGTIDESAIIEIDDKIQLEPSVLTELFYNGILGEL